MRLHKHVCKPPVLPSASVWLQVSSASAERRGKALQEMAKRARLEVPSPVLLSASLQDFQQEAQLTSAPGVQIKATSDLAKDQRRYENLSFSR